MPARAQWRRATAPPAAGTADHRVATPPATTPLRHRATAPPRQAAGPPGRQAARPPGRQAARPTTREEAQGQVDFLRAF
ncbi:hypothetical protein AB0H83_47565, partial [Dactylosporangium sp. NPDC050688]